MRKKLIALFVVFILITMIMPTAFAKEEKKDTMATPSVTMTAESDSMETTQMQEKKPLEVFDATGHYVTTQSFKSDHFMIGLFSENTESFNTGKWDILDAEFTLSFSTTQIVSELLSDITISINGVRFYSERIPVTDGLRREITVKIPIEHIIEGYNVIKIEGYLRTYNGLPCVDDVSAANWMNMFKESYIKIIYDPKPSELNISEFYNKFSSIDALENHESAVVIATDYDSQELDVALTTLAGMSRNATLFYENVDFIAADDLSYIKDKKYVIYIAKDENLPSDLKSYINNSKLSYSSDESQMLLVNNDVNVLIVTGENGDSLDSAAALLSDKTTMNQLKITSKIINQNEDIDMRKEGVKQYIDFAGNGTYVDGAFRQTANYFIDFPQDRWLSYGSEVSLFFRYAENLDFDRSLVTIYINNIPIGSQKLSQAKAGNDTLVVSIPTDIDVIGSFTLSVSFDLEIKDLWCTLRQPDTPWAYITKDSMLKVNSIDVPHFLFENYPYPFITAGAFDNTILIVPDDNMDINLTVIGNIMKTMGQYIKYNTGSFQVVRASEDVDLDGKNIITIGTYENNQFIAQLNDELFFQFNVNGSSIKSNEKLLIVPSYGATLSTAQLLLSPYSKTKNALFAITSVDNDNLINVTKYFSDNKELWKIYGDGFVADNSDIHLYRFKEENDKKESISDVVAQRANLMTLIYVGVGIVIILLVAVILLLIKYKRRRKDEK